MQSKHFQPQPRVAAAHPVMHPHDQISPERIIGVVLWLALFVVLMTFAVR